MSHNFTYGSYQQTIRDFLENEYYFLTFSEFDINKNQRKVLMRHDIDLDVSPALNLAKFENQIGIKSNYFFRVNAKNYNILSLPTLNSISIIKDLGHEIGLHLDGNYLIKESNELKTVKSIKNFLESKLNERIISLSIHEPSRTSMEIDETVMDYLGFKFNAYGDKYFKNIKYLSDSGGRWREGHFGEWVNKEDKFQILTHPFWWYKIHPQENY
jgi:hypothetical protein